MAGRRHESETPVNVQSLSPEGWAALEKHVETLPARDGAAMDYFVFRTCDARQIFEKFPPFLIGAKRWDQTLLALFYRDSDVTVFDVSLTAPVLHQVSTSLKHEHRHGASLGDLLSREAVGPWMYRYGKISYADADLRRKPSGALFKVSRTPLVKMRDMFKEGSLNGENLYLYRANERDLISEGFSGRVNITRD